MKDRTNTINLDTSYEKIKLILCCRIGSIRLNRRKLLSTQFRVVPVVHTKSGKKLVLIKLL